VLVRHGALFRCLLVLLESVAGNTLRAGATSDIHIGFGTEADEVVVRLRGAASRDQLLFSGEGSLLHAVRAALAHARATVDGAIHRHAATGEIEYEVRLPNLTTARAMELTAS
jgi:hypothetical protein